MELARTDRRVSTPRWILGLCMGLTLALIPGCGGNSEPRPEGLVLIVIDTLRGDRLGCTGYASAVSPNLDALAASGTRFDDAMTPVPVTLPATSSLMTGRYPFHHGVRDNNRFQLPEAEETLAERFLAKGWRTGAVIGAAVLAADQGIAQGFETYDEAFTGPYPAYEPSLRYLADDLAETRRRADDVTDRALETLEGFGGDNFFLFVHYYDVHQHYDPPPAFAAMHAQSLYDGEISFVDHEIGRLLAAVRERHPNALVVVTADHGEGLGDHGEPGHGFLLYQTTLRVPLIVAGPGVPEGVVRTDPVSLIDLEPTLGATFDLPRAGEDRDGRVLAWDAAPQSAPELYAETFRSLVSYNWSELRALRRGGDKIIQARDRCELYDLETDPAETTDLGDTGPSGELLACMESLTGFDDPEVVYAAARGVPDDGRTEVLASLGYLSAAPTPPTMDRPHPLDEIADWMDYQWSKEMLRGAIMLIEDGKVRRGITLLDSVVVLNPRMADAWFVRGDAKERLGEHGREDFQRALEIVPDHVAALAGLADCANQAGALVEAKSLWERVHDADPSHERALVYLAQWHVQHGEEETALPFLRRLVSRKPEDAAIRFNLGLAAHRTGRRNEAQEHLGAYLELVPEEDPTAVQVRELLGP